MLRTEWMHYLHEEGNKHFKNGEYEKAISIYSKSIRKFHQWENSGTTIAHGVKLNQRARCYMKLKQWDKALRDSNLIIRAFKKEPLPLIRLDEKPWPSLYTPRISERMHDSECNPEAIALCKQALMRRQEIYGRLGNSGRAYGDHFALMSKPFLQRTEYDAKLHLHFQNTMHPSPQSIIKCNENTLQTNIFPKIGWVKVSPAPSTKPLPMKSGHAMVRFGSDIYCVGGSAHPQSPVVETNIFFMKIMIYKEGKSYLYEWEQIKIPFHIEKQFLKVMCKDEDSSLDVWKETKFPFAIARQILMDGKNDTEHYKMSIFKWNDRLILFGNSVPPKLILIFYPNTGKWNVLRTDITPLGNFTFAVQTAEKAFLNLNGHTAVMMNEKIFVYCYVRYKHQHIFCYLDLRTKTWYQLPLHKRLRPRIKQMMWSDPKQGTAGSIYIGFGVHALTQSPHTYNFDEIFRFDVFREQWIRQPIDGNAPYKRGQMGYTFNKSGAIMFGGYTETLLSNGGKSKFVYFGDAFKFSNRNQNWKMIHTDIYPDHRAEPGMCYYNKNIVILYGGYQGGINVNYNDLWLLDLTNAQQIRKKSKFCALCGKTNRQCKLFLCASCKSAFHCSKFCQKKDWKRHIAHCKS